MTPLHTNNSNRMRTMKDIIYIFVILLKEQFKR